VVLAIRLSGTFRVAPASPRARPSNGIHGVRLLSESRRARRCCCTGPVYPYDYSRLNSWDGSYQQANVSTYYNAQKHAHCYPGNSKQGSAGWFQ